MKMFLENLSMKRYLLSFLAAFLITIILCGIVGVMFSLFNPSEWLYNLFVSYFCYLSATVAAFLSVLGAQKNGLITGAICADIHMLLLIFIGMLIFKNEFPSESAMKIFSISSALGAIAGILGINFKK